MPFSRRQSGIVPQVRSVSFAGIAPGFVCAGSGRQLRSLADFGRLGPPTCAAACLRHVGEARRRPGNERLIERCARFHDRTVVYFHERPVLEPPSRCAAVIDKRACSGRRHSHVWEALRDQQGAAASNCGSSRTTICRRTSTRSARANGRSASISSSPERTKCSMSFGQGVKKS